MSSMQVSIINGSPIGVVKINFNLTKEEKKIISNLNYLKKDKTSPFLSKNPSIFKNKKLKRIENVMFEWVEKYKNEILQIGNELRLVHSWATINDNTNHHSHAHMNSLISCCFYVENEGKNEIIFNTEKSTLEKCHYFAYDIKEYNFFNSSIWKIDIDKGMIVIFLSDLKHKSINKGKKTMIGTNYFVTGEIGRYENYTYLKI